MNNLQARNFLPATLVAGLLSLTAAAAFAQEGDDARVSRGPAGRAVAFCDGFAQEAILTNTQNSPVSTASAAFVTMPNTTINGGGSGGGIDLYTVTFSGQASATGGGFWEIQAQVSVNGGAFIDMNPNDPNTFHSGNPAQTNTMTWCREIAAASTQFRIVWRKLGGGAAIVDDYLMRVERSN